MTSNIVGPSNTPSKSKERQLAISSEESDVEPSSVLKEILIEPKGINQRTRIQIALIDYNTLVRGNEVNNKHSAIVESQSSNSYMEKEAFVHIVNTVEEIAQVQKKQLDMLQA